MTLSRRVAEQIRGLGFDPNQTDLLDWLLERTAGNLEWLADVQRRWPLATSVLWQAPEAEWDQRRALAAVMRAPEIGLVLGGERSGKSLLAKQYAVACIMGGDHPAVLSWLALNALPLDAIDPGPADVYISALDSNLSKKLHRRDLRKLLPGALWHNERGKGEASLVYRLPDYDEPSYAWFKGVDQGWESYQGTSIRLGWIDEEARGEEGRLVVEQNLSRAADQGGLVLLTMAPLAGLTWTHDEYVRDRKRDVVIAYLDTLDNPHVSDAMRRRFAGMDDVDLQRRRFGKFHAREGLVYNQWTEGDGSREGSGHLCRPFEIPKDWTRFRAADFGIVAPTCVLWGAMGDDEILYVYRELYRDDLTYQQTAERIVELEKGEIIEQGWADPSARDAIDACAEADVYFDKASNDVKAGIDAVRNRMRVREDGRPRIKVFDTCTGFMREIREYRWDDRRKDDVPVKKNDHAMDAAKYLAVGVDEYYAP